MSFSALPRGAAASIKPYKIAIPAEKVRAMEQLIKLCPIAPETFENLQTDGKFGLSRAWLEDARQKWMNEFKWEQQEAELNTLPHFMANVKDEDGLSFDVHFMAFFSQKPDAVPIVFSHGWPGSFLEFIDMFKVLKDKYNNDPTQLPYHLIAPSLPGWTLSSGPPTDRNWIAADSARIIHKLMVDLGFGDGYVAQGGDIGAFISQCLTRDYPACKAMHLNFIPITTPPKGAKPPEEFEPADLRALENLAKWPNELSAYAREHGTRPATIGLVLSSSPLAVLSWVGEKFLSWTDQDPPMTDILTSISLYWLTDTMARNIYTYREIKSYSFEKPWGYSWFPFEMLQTPHPWLEAKGGLVWFKRHESGGHFAAWEKPAELASDIEEFVAKVWPGGVSKL